MTHQAYSLDQAASALKQLGYSVRPHGARFLVAYGDANPTPMKESELISLASGLSNAEAAPAWTATCGACGQQFISDSPVMDGALCSACRPPTQALAITSGVLIGVAMMDAGEARAVVSRIKGRIEEARKDLLDLHDREGWKALGYNSWGACAKAEFGGSAATLYRQLEAAEIERDVMGDSQVENPAPIPTAQLQAVKQLAPEQRKAAFERADALAGETPRTAAHVAQAAAEISQPYSMEAAFPLTLRKQAQRLGAEIASSFDITRQRAAVWLPAEPSSRWMSVDELTSWCAEHSAPAQPTPKRIGMLTSHQYHTTDLDALLLAQLERTGYTWTSAAQTPDGRWHHLIRSRDTNLQRWQQIRLRRERIVLLLTPSLDDILKRLDAHGYAKIGTREKGMTTFYSFRDYRSTLADGQAGELELAEGELSLWLTELDTNAAYAQAKQEKYLEARDRAERMGYTLERFNALFRLYTPGHGIYEQGTLDQLLRSIATREHKAAKSAAAPTLAQLDAQLPKALEKAGYFWQSAAPPVIAHNDGWRGERPTFEAALQLAQDRERAKAQPFDMNGVARLSYKLGATADRAAAIAIWREIGSLIGADAAPIQQALDMPANPRDLLAHALESLSPVIATITPDDLEGLSQAIADLNECVEGSESTHWLNVGWALLDLEAQP